MRRLSRNLSSLHCDRSKLHFRKTRGRRLWELLPETWKQDQEAAFLCWQSGMVGKNDPPSCLDDDFFRTKIERGAIRYWSALPKHYRKNSGFARSISIFPERSLFADMIQLLPELCVERNVLWAKAIESKVDLANMSGLAPAEVRAAKGLMLKACLCSGECLQFVDTTLQLDRKFLEVILAGAPVALKHIVSSAQQAFPELMVDHFQAFSSIPHHYDISGNYITLARNMCVDLWPHRHTVTSWFKAGLLFPFDSVPNSITDPWASDKELLLLLATYCKGCDAESF